MNRLEIIEALKLSEDRIRAVRQELERLEREDAQRRYLEGTDTAKFPQEIAKLPSGRPIIDHSKKGELHRARQARYKARLAWLKLHPEARRV